MEAFEFTPEIQDKLDANEKKAETVQSEVIKFSIEKQKPVYEERDAILSTIEKFWPKAIYNCTMLAMLIDDEDREVFESLKAVRVDRSAADAREVSVHFDFNDNEFFSNKTLSKTFTPVEDAEQIGSDEYDFTLMSETKKTTIDWKSDEKNLAKKNPIKAANGDKNGATEEDEFEPPTGSFFANFFEATDENSAALGDMIINLFYPRAPEYYTGDALDDLDFDDDDDEFDEEYDEEDDDDDDREIDLEAEDDEPAAKKQKN